MNRVRWFTVFTEKCSPARLSLRYEPSVKYDYYEVTINKDGTNYLFESYENEQVKVKKWNNGVFDEVVHFPQHAINDNEIQIKHYYRSYIYHYSSLTDLNRHNWHNRLRARWNNAIHGSRQHLLKMRKLESRGRYTLLHDVVEMYFEEDNRGPVSALHVLTKSYSNQWLHHRDGAVVARKTSFILQSLVASGDLSVDQNGGYTPQPKALASLDDYRREEQRDSRDYSQRTWTLAVSAMALFLSFLFSLASLIISVIRD